MPKEVKPPRASIASLQAELVAAKLDAKKAWEARDCHDATVNVLRQENEKLWAHVRQLCGLKIDATTDQKEVAYCVRHGCGTSSCQEKH